MRAVLPIRGLPNERNRGKKRGEILYRRRIGEFSFKKVYFKESKENGEVKLYLSVRHAINFIFIHFFSQRVYYLILIFTL